MAASPLPQNILVVLFGHDPNVVDERCFVLHKAGYETVIATTAREAEEYIASRAADVLLVGSQTGPLTRLRLTEMAHRSDIAVVHITYHNHPQPQASEVYVTRPLGPDELLEAMAHAVQRMRKSR